MQLNLCNVKIKLVWFKKNLYWNFAMDNFTITFNKIKKIYQRDNIIIIICTITYYIHEVILITNISDINNNSV